MFVSVLSIERKNLNVYLIFTLNIFSNNGVEENKKIVFLNNIWTKFFPVTKTAEVKHFCLILSVGVYYI